MLSTTAEWLGTDKSMRLSVTDYEAINLRLLSPNQRLGEPELYATKWFDYRLLHPMQANFYFCHCYAEIYQAWFKRTVDAEDKTARGVRYKAMEGKEAGDILQCRRFCDKHGLTYGFFILDIIKKLNIDNRNYFPRFSALVPKDVQEEAVLLKDWQASKLITAKDPFFQTDHWTDNPMQIDYENYVVQKLRQKPITADRLFSVIFLQKALRIERAQREFPLDTIKGALETYKEILKLSR